MTKGKKKVSIWSAKRAGQTPTRSQTEDRSKELDERANEYLSMVNLTVSDILPNLLIACG